MRRIRTTECRWDHCPLQVWLPNSPAFPLLALRLLILLRIQASSNRQLFWALLKNEVQSIIIEVMLREVEA